MGRPEKSKNKSKSHKAGGPRLGAGKKSKAYMQARAAGQSKMMQFFGKPTEEEHDEQVGGSGSGSENNMEDGYQSDQKQPAAQPATREAEPHAKWCARRKKIMDALQS
jgi:hypothetical protein